MLACGLCALGSGRQPHNRHHPNSSHLQTLPRPPPSALPPSMEDAGQPNPTTTAAMVKQKKDRLPESDKRAARREKERQCKADATAASARAAEVQVTAALQARANVEIIATHVAHPSCDPYQGEGTGRRTCGWLLRARRCTGLSDELGLVHDSEAIREKETATVRLAFSLDMSAVFPPTAPSTFLGSCDTLPEISSVPMVPMPPRFDLNDTLSVDDVPVRSKTRPHGRCRPR